MKPRLPPVSIRTRLTLWYSAILLAILVTISVLSYSWLRWSLIQDLDASLLTVAQVIQDTGFTGSPGQPPGDPEALLRELLGPELYDKSFRLLDPEGRPYAPAVRRSMDELPLSPEARAKATRGRRTFETAHGAGAEAVRVLTRPIVRNGRMTEIAQVGMPLHRAQTALNRYLDTLILLIPLGVGLAAVGGAVIAGAALRRVDQMARTARRITAEDLSQRVGQRGKDDELDRLAETLNGMLARLEEAFAQTRRFAADAAHELRTPLTVLRGGIEVALRAARSPEEYRQVLGSVIQTSSYANLVHKMRDRIEALRKES